MAANYKYFAHGLPVYSEFEIPELFPLEKVLNIVDPVIIRYAQVPEALEGFQSQVSLQIQPGHFLFKNKNIVNLYVHDGKQILVQVHECEYPDAFRQFVLGFGLGAILHQRGLLALHGSAVVTPNGALIFVGDSGAGKSTAIAAFHAAGYPILSDDVCHIDLSDPTQPCVHSGTAQIKLNRDSAEILQRDLDTVECLVWGKGKYLFPLTTIPERKKAPLFAICGLIKDDSQAMHIKPLKQFDIFRLLVENTYGKRTLKRSKQQDLHFEKIATLANNVQAGMLFRPQQAFQIEEMINTVGQALQIPAPHKQGSVE